MQKVSRAKQLFYKVKPIIPRKTQLMLRRKRAARIREHCKFRWPILHLEVKQPYHWAGWPDDNRFAVVMSHDVEWAKGRDRCEAVMELEKRLGFRSCFNFVPERYETSYYLRRKLLENNFEVGVHGLKHDGKLYQSRELFLERAPKINDYLERWHANGVHTPARHHRLDWNHAWNAEYVSSTFDTDPFEPQADGVGTIFPFCVADKSSNSTYIELPYTMAQDHCLYIILQEQSIDIWKKKIDWIAKHGGMVFVITHPDYMNFGETPMGLEEYPVERYVELLTYLREKFGGEYWQALPREVAAFWKEQGIQTEYDVVA